MTKQEFMDAIELNYQCEPLDDKDGFQLFIDGFFGDFTITINADDTFNINIDVFDEHYDMRCGSEKFHDAFTLACYKSVVSALENVFRIDYELIKSRSFDTNRGLVHTIDYYCKGFDIDFINHIYEALANDAYVGVEGFHGSAYKQALLETIANDDDYKEKNAFLLDGDKLWLSPGYAMMFTDDISGVLPDANFEDFIEADDIYIGLNYTVIKSPVLDKMAVINSKYIKLFNRISDEYEISDLKYYSDFLHLQQQQ